MSARAAALLLLAMKPLATHAEPPRSWAAGCWQVAVPSPIVLIPDQSGRFEIVVDGGQVSGTVHMMGKVLPITAGTVTEDRLAFTVTGKDRQMQVEGTRTAEGAAGRMLGAIRPLSWTGTRCP